MYLCGAISTGLGLFNLVPQLITLYANKSSVGVSFYYISLRILAHVLNIVSTSHKKLQTMIIGLSVYHFIADIIFLSMVVYYYKNVENHNWYTYFKYKSLFVGVLVINTILVIVFIDDFIADLIAWIASSIFIISLFPLIFKIIKLKTVENLNIITFIMKYMNLLFHLLSIVSSSDDIARLLPWIVGLSSSCIIELFVFYLFYRYKRSYTPRTLLLEEVDLLI
jgi:hypothetical protein